MINYLLFSLLLLFVFLPLIEGVDGIIGFHVDLNESDSGIRGFHERMVKEFGDYDKNLVQWIVPRENLTFWENGFHLTDDGEKKMPRILNRISKALCDHMEDGYFPTLNIMRLYFPRFIEISAIVNGDAVFESISAVLLRYGLSSYSSEFSPRKLVLARVSRVTTDPSYQSGDIAFPRVSGAWKVPSSIKVFPKIVFLKCSWNYKEGPCFYAMEKDVKFPCSN